MMELATTRNPVQDAGNVSHPIDTLVDFPRVRRHTRSVRSTLGQLLTAIVNGSEHPCWRSHDVFAQVALFPPEEASRLLDSGRVTRKGES